MELKKLDEFEKNLTSICKGHFFNLQPEVIEEIIFEIRKNNASTRNIFFNCIDRWMFDMKNTTNTNLFEKTKQFASQLQNVISGELPEEPWSIIFGVLHILNATIDKDMIERWNSGLHCDIYQRLICLTKFKYGISDVDHLIQKECNNLLAKHKSLSESCDMLTSSQKDISEKKEIEQKPVDNCIEVDLLSFDSPVTKKIDKIQESLNDVNYDFFSMSSIISNINNTTEKIEESNIEPKSKPKLSLTHGKPISVAKVKTYNVRPAQNYERTITLSPKHLDEKLSDVGADPFLLF